MINFHILGAGGAVPTASHTPAAYQVVVDGTPYFMDPGPGALVRLVRSGLAPRGVDDIRTVLMTHLHPDHCADLVPLLFAMHSPVTKQTADLFIFGPPGLNSYLNALQGLYGNWLMPFQRKLRVQEVTPGKIIELPEGGKIVAFEVNHPQSRLCQMCLGYTFIDRHGKTAVFSGDTGPCEELKNAARGCDLLVVECSTTNDYPLDGHMTPERVGQLCAEALPERVVLTHMYPEAAAADLVSEVNQHFAGTVIQACDGNLFTIPDPAGSGEDIK